LPYITYAIGDVHGRADLLEPLLDAVIHDARSYGSEPRILFLGDIVDRGPCSREAMDLVCNVLAEFPRSKLIRGNHDAYFLEFMTAAEIDEDRYLRWLDQGGHRTMDSYDLMFTGTVQRAAEIFKADHPQHLQALQAASDIVVDERHAFVHAGVNPARPIADQDPKDLMLIRKGFLEHEGPLSHVIVHGHTVTKDFMPEVKANRICIDTGAYHSGRLTCLAVSPDERNLHFLFATAINRRVRISTQESVALRRVG
jgi:serine/threonine protein phosphatase 1